MAEQQTKRPYPAHWEADVLLRDGATARLRPVSPNDADALQQMHQGQSQDSIYFRYFTYKSQLSAKELERFTVVDYVDRSEEHTSELQSRGHIVCRLLLE